MDISRSQTDTAPARTASRTITQRAENQPQTERTNVDDRAAAPPTTMPPAATVVNNPASRSTATTAAKVKKGAKKSEYTASSLVKVCGLPLADCYRILRSAAALSVGEDQLFKEGIEQAIRTINNRNRGNQTGKTEGRQVPGLDVDEQELDACLMCGSTVEVLTMASAVSPSIFFDQRAYCDVAHNIRSLPLYWFTSPVPSAVLVANQYRGLLACLETVTGEVDHPPLCMCTVSSVCSTIPMASL